VPNHGARAVVLVVLNGVPAAKNRDPVLVFDPNPQPARSGIK